MPTFFGRRVMRGAPGRTERTLGAALLVFVVAIALAFALTTGAFGDSAARSNLAWAIKSVLGISDQPLFTVDRSKIPPPDPHGIRALHLMLPDSVDELGLCRGSECDPGVLTAETVSRCPGGSELLESAKLYDANVVYHAEYVNTKTKGSVWAYLVDAGGPESAFGIWQLRQRADGDSPPEGRAAEQGAHWAHFQLWAGRFYIELAFQGSDSDARKLAQALAGRQLNYGRPFWAESVLPTDGRTEGSLRFVKRDPLGLKLTADCWLADYAGGMTIGVMKASPEQREAVLAAVKDTSATVTGKPTSEAGEEKAEGATEEEAAEAKTEPKPADTASSPGPAAPRSISATPAGEYVFLAAGPDAAAVAATLKPLVDRWSAVKPEAGAPAVASTPPAGGQGPFVDLGDPQILAPTKIERYTDNLYEKIDGREPQFRQFGFVELRVGSYQHVPKQAVYDAYIFDMGEPVNAMGIYMTEKSGSSHSLAIGRDGYASGASAYFWKGRYYIYILGPADAGDEAAAVAERIARGIEKTIVDKREPFWAEKLLPAEDRVPDSLSYRAGSGLGFDFLQRMFVASYKTGDKTYQMYIIRAESPTEAKTVFDKFAEATAKYDKIVGRSGSATDANGETVVSESLGVFGVAFHKGVYFAGVAECDDRALAEKKAGALRDSLAGK